MLCYLMIRLMFSCSQTFHLEVQSISGLRVIEWKTTLLSRAVNFNLTSSALGSLFFAGGDISFLGANHMLSRILDAWQTTLCFGTATRSDLLNGTLVNNTVSFDRLDCYWPYCFGPSSSLPTKSYYPLIDGGNICNINNSFTTQGNKSTLPHQRYYILLSAASNSVNCDYDLAILNVTANYPSTLLAGVILAVSNLDIALTQVGKSGIYEFSMVVTSISYEDGQKLKVLLNGTPNNNTNSKSVHVEFTTRNSPGNFAIIDTQSRLQSIGSTTAASMMVASWAGQYEGYRQNLLQSKLTQAAFTVPIFIDTVVGAASMSISPETLGQAARGYERLEIDTMITCKGLYDSDCSRWDHVITINMYCLVDDVSRAESMNKRAQHQLYSQQQLNLPEFEQQQLKPLEVGGSPNEIARYVTPFRRRGGRWLTDITPLLSRLTSSSIATCSSIIFDAFAGGEQWLVTSTLRFSLAREEVISLDEQQAMTVVLPLYSIYQSLTPSFNTQRQPLTFTLPLSYTTSSSGKEDSENKKQVERAVLLAYITTHGSDRYGCCEFLPTRHVFTINDQQQYNTSFDEAGSEWGCSNQVSHDSIPNEYGTWWYGRGGWCDGINVEPIAIDITSSLLSGAANKNNNSNSSCLDLEVKYEAFMWFKGMYQSPQSESQSGYIIHSSQLVIYFRPDNSSSSQLIDDQNDDATEGSSYVPGSDDSNNSTAAADSNNNDDDLYHISPVILLGIFVLIPICVIIYKYIQHLQEEETRRLQQQHGTRQDVQFSPLQRTEKWLLLGMQHCR